ncbi:type I pullulanase [Paenibacillus shirakamiensis]|uniref:type I pullulanase n=1 Tax=Paenibacillus shirakamiensis TaxID=1265935 RepID=UPI003CCA28C8
MQLERNIHIDYGDPATTGGISIFEPEFDQKYVYAGDDLGCRYTSERAFFRVWAPTSSEVLLILYRSWNGKSEQMIPMHEDVHGTWTLSVQRDLKGYLYTYLVRIGEQWNEAVDPYARAVGLNGDRGAIVDMQSTNPERWNEDKPVFQKPTDAIIYELHIRDLSIHPESGMEHKGKFKAFTEIGTTGPQGIKTGIDHVVDLGVTHVQLLPIFDYSTLSVDEARLDQPQFNWGYDPKNYNVPEGSYSSDPYTPETRIRELKELIQSLHDRGLRVIMDVVYNHVYDGFVVNFTKLVPGYYLRYQSNGTFSNGSGCGNDVASERPMMSKFIVDSILYWVHEYHMDGFRFDLMGLLDVGTMQEIRRRLDEIDPTILTIGEGWIMETELPYHLRANQLQSNQLSGFGFFNDVMRDALRGSLFNPRDRGFISGGDYREQGIRQGVVACVPYSWDISGFATEPSQTVNYTECHDNHTLWDKITLSVDWEQGGTRRQMHRLATSIVLTSQGIAFLHAGQEFYRTKIGFENSYNMPDEVNRLDWERCAEHADDVRNYRELIALRRNHPAFRLGTADEIRRHLHFEECLPGTVAYTLRDHAGGEENKHLYVMYSHRRDHFTLTLPQLGEWNMLYSNTEFQRLDHDKLAVEGIGMVVLCVK